jgi:hypothetical protein
MEGWTSLLQNKFAMDAAATEKNQITLPQGADRMNSKGRNASLHN